MRPIIDSPSCQCRASKMTLTRSSTTRFTTARSNTKAFPTLCHPTPGRGRRASSRLSLSITVSPCRCTTRTRTGTSSSCRAIISAIGSDRPSGCERLPISDPIPSGRFSIQRRCIKRTRAASRSRSYSLPSALGSSYRTRSPASACRFPSTRGPHRLAKLTRLPQRAQQAADGALYMSWIVGMKYTFTLRDGLRWHDGQLVESEDCVESLKIEQNRDLRTFLFDNLGRQGWLRPNFLHPPFRAEYVDAMPAHDPGCVKT